METITIQTYEVYIQYKEAKGYFHVGSLRAPNSELALDQAKEVYTRRDDCIDFFIVPSQHLYRLDGKQTDLLKIAADKEYRKPGYFTKSNRKAGGKHEEFESVDHTMGG
jgi:ring-1,2-phenylacetyl-CoA epoxidase subunit PaaB